MHKLVESLEFLNARMIETLAATGFRLTFRTMHRLSKQAESSSKASVENLDKGKNTSIQKVYFEFKLLQEDELFLEVRFTSEGEYQDDHERHISDLTQPLTQEMARNFAEGAWFVLLSDHINFVSSKVYASLLKHLMAAIPAEKFLLIYCLMNNFESTLETLVRHCRNYQLQAAVAAGQIHSNLELHVVRRI